MSVRVQHRNVNTISRRTLLVALGLLGMLLALMGLFAFLYVPMPLTADERVLLGTWEPDASAEFSNVFIFQSDRTAVVVRAEGERDEYRWKLDGNFLMVQVDGERGWERLGPILLEKDKLVLQPNGPVYSRKRESTSE